MDITKRREFPGQKDYPKIQLPLGENAYFLFLIKHTHTHPHTHTHIDNMATAFPC